MKTTSGMLSQTTCVLMSETQPPWNDLSGSMLCWTQHHGTLTLEQLLCIFLLYHTVRHDLSRRQCTINTLVQQHEDEFISLAHRHKLTRARVRPYALCSCLKSFYVVGFHS